MRYLLFFGVLLLLQSCGTNQFAKRKYTKGVYISKHSHGKTKPQKRNKRREGELTSNNALDNNNVNLTVLEEPNFSEFSEKDDLGGDEEASGIVDIEEKPLVIGTQQLPVVELIEKDILEPTKSTNKLELASFILAMITAAIEFATLIPTLILWFLDFVGSIVMPFGIFPILPMALAFLLGIITLIIGSISYSRERSGKSRAAIIVGSIVVGLSLLFLLVTLLVV